VEQGEHDTIIKLADKFKLSKEAEGLAVQGDPKIVDCVGLWWQI
jgi:hypothetical protein